MGRWLIVVLGVLLIFSAPRLYTAASVNIGALATLKQLASKGLPGWGNNDPFWQEQVDIAAANTFFERAQVPFADDRVAQEALGRGRIIQGGAAGALEPLSRAVTQAPSEALAHYWNGVALWRTQQPEAAVAEWRKTNAALFFWWIGYQARREGRLERAEIYLTAAARVDPQLGQAYEELAQLYWSSGQNDKLSAAVEKARANAPSDTYTLTFLTALVRYRVGDWAGAGEALRQVIQHDPTNRGAQELLGNVDAQLEDWDGVIAQLEPLARMPNPSTRVNELLGVAYLMKLRYADAKEYLLKATKATPTNAALWFALGNSYAGLLDTSNAIPAYRKAVEVAPAFIPYHFKLAQTYEGQGNFRAAVDEYNAILKLDPNMTAADEARAKAQKKIKP